MESQFTFAAPRLLISQEDQFVVHDALHWGLPERRPEGEDLCPTQRLWKGTTGAHGDHVTQATTKFGFSKEDLENTLEVLQGIIDDPLFLEFPTHDASIARKVVHSALGTMVHVPLAATLRAL